MVDQKLTLDYQPHSYDDPSANLWSTYLSKSEKYDKTVAQNWKSDMDAILIFAGLFSASLTAFIVESYKTLNPDSDSASAFLLSQILLHQLASGGNSSSSSVPDLTPILSQFDQSSFSPSVSSIICNILWFLSLGFSLVCALSATMIEQWTRQYLQASTSRPAPQDRARMNAYLNQGIKRYKMATIVEIIPPLLHISLFLFFAGLVAFLSAINSILQYIMLVLLICCCLLYLVVTVLPTFDLSCPYWTPLSGHCWSLLRKLSLLSRRDADGNELPVALHMTTARELDAIEITPQRDQRDLKSMCWTLSSLREDNEFEPFVEVIPAVVSGFDYSAKWLMDCLTKHDDIAIKLGHRIPGLLVTCNAQVLDPATAQKRAITCIKAMWSLTMLSMPNPAAAQDPLSFRGKLVFKEDTFGLIERVQNRIPSVEPYGISTSVVIGRALLDTYIDRVTILENDLAILMQTGQLPEHWTEKKRLEVIGIMTPTDVGKLLEISRSRMQAVMDGEFAALKGLTRPFPYILLEGLVFHLTRLVAVAPIPRAIYGLDTKLILEISDCLNIFSAIVNQAGMNLCLEYIESILQAEVLPHEAFNTLRRTFFRIDFGMRLTDNPGFSVNINYEKKPTFSKVSQERLVAYLEEVVEPTALHTRVPHSIIGIILTLTGRALSSSTLILKAIGIVENYTKFNTNDSAPKALQNLMRSLPDDARGCKPLDLFSSHVSADAKPERPLTKSRTNTLASSVTMS
ncbi:hypothetical protein HYPSUDRAFT_34059 [Hypholoma sublateritium FD-334 SS-4]|uniref:DUF6535 domain-containing protein n=1 Tax=Hypholoma sublateritium (strain FD-334 SS-4) TaxID=945553 RepID=A0A0D2PCN8_HYPSF|nr:hypothetical protein HYPSUDRAFT_34059 [Hypholoma sublateritium FD-334 SS-4]